MAGSLIAELAGTSAGSGSPHHLIGRIEEIRPLRNSTAIKKPRPVGCFRAAAVSPLMLFDAARVGSAASMSSLAVKKAAGQIYVPASLRRKNLFMIVPAMLSDRSRTSDVNRFDSEIFSRAMTVSMRLCAITISTIRHGEHLPGNHALQRVHCFNSNEVRVVTFAQRRGNDSL